MKLLMLYISWRIISGYCTKIVRQISDCYKEGSKFEATKEISISTLNWDSCNKCEYECFNSAGDCRYIKDDVKRVYSEILNHDMTIFIIPVYSDYPCSNYFIFRERSQFVFDSNGIYEDFLSKKKKFIIISNTSDDDVIKVLKNDNKSIRNEDVFIVKTQDYNVKSVKGSITENRAFISNLDTFLNNIK